MLSTNRLTVQTHRAVWQPCGSRSRPFRVCAAALALTMLLGALVMGTTVVRACGLDGKPSMLGNGRLVRINPSYPQTDAQVAYWAVFALPGSYGAGQVVALTENRAEVARTLLPQAMLRPWRWTFGDGATAYGWTVRHTYARAGHWRITTYAYDPGSRTWNNFDQAVITVKR